MLRSSVTLWPTRFLIRASLLFAAALLVGALAPAQQATVPQKRPLKHTDYDSWRSIQSPALARDGQYLAYNLMPAEGDGEFVVRNVTSGAEHRLPRGRAVAAASGDQGASGGVAPAPTPPALPARFGGRGLAGAAGLSGGTHQFTPDVKAIVFQQVPTKVELDKAKADKKQPEEMPRTALAIMDLATGKITTRLEGATSFSVGGHGAGLLLYRRQARAEDRPTGSENKSTQSEEKPSRPAPGGASGATARRPLQRTYGSDLVIRNLADAGERVLKDVLDYNLTKDGKTLVYTVASRKEETNGVYVLTPPTGSPMPILTGKGRYQRLTWDEKQTQLVFASDKEDVASAQPKFKIYHWTRAGTSYPVADASKVPPMGDTAPAAASSSAAQATDLLGPNPQGLRTGWVISDRAGFSFSSDGSRLYFSTGPAPTAQPDEPATPTPPTTPIAPAGFTRRGGGARGGALTPRADDNKVVLDLWHWKDELIQPMQKVRASREQNRTYRAVYFLKDKVFCQLADETMDVNPAPDGDWATGSDDRKYRHLTGYGPSLSDYALVNMRTGEKRPLLQASQWAATFSPRGRYLLYFDGKDWHSVTVPEAKKTNLTAKLPVKFVREQWDTPSEAPAYPIAGWSTDEKYVLLSDRYDIWKVAVDGSEAKPLTGGYGRKSHIAFRLVRLAQGEEERERGVDLAKPLLLKATNERTHDEGFFRLDPGSREPKMLLMGARRYGQPLKAKDADTLLLTVSSSYDYPDYYVATADFRELRRVTDANPQKRDFVWGKAELLRYKNLDGVELSGVLIKPEDFDPAKKYPLLVYIYEKLSQHLHNFTNPSPGTSINAAYYASNGYLVFMPDIVYTVGSPG
ncbi:MAG: hypothetical protein L0Z62_04930, partial [Gemmataceae bacterium]|nr:hypothetical protein [Gemmataceae bacterium]